MRTSHCIALLQTLLFVVVLSSVHAKGTFYGSPYRYNLYKFGSAPHPGKPMSRHKNFCAYIVQRNISCVMQDGVATYVKAEYMTKCIWGQKCPVLMYRTFHKPMYKVGYKTITELEWRCCPGFSGENCFDGSTSHPDGMMPPFKGSPPRTGMKGYSRGHPKGHPDHRFIPGENIEPGKPYPVPGGHPDQRPIPTGQLPSGPGGPRVGVSGERLDRMEEDLKRLSQSMETLSGMVVGLEERLRVSLREDTTKMLGSLLTGTPRLPDSSVGFGEIPDGLGGGQGFPGFGELVGRVTEVKDELRLKSGMLEEIQGMVMGHDGQLKRLMEAATGRPVPGGVIPGGVVPGVLEELLDARLAGVRAEILDGFEKRLRGLEDHCEERIGQVQQECRKEHMNGQEEMQQSLDGRETGIRKELGDLQAQIQGLTLTENCCGLVNSLSQRLLLLEDSVKGLTESQRTLQVVTSDQMLHVEALLDARLVDMEGRINASERGGEAPPGLDSLDGFKTLLDEKLRGLEERLLVAVEELSNATAPALLEGHVVPALETEIQDVRRRVEADLDGVQKQLTDLELLCTSSCSPAGPDGDLFQTDAEDRRETERRVSGRLDEQGDRLDRLNGTLMSLLMRLAEDEDAGSVQGEITLLKINVNSVNRTLKGLRDSVSLFAHEVGRANSTWQQREQRLSTQVHGVTELVGRQASMLSASERRLAQLKAELQSLRRRLAGELEGCRSTAMGVQREVLGVESRVSRVEGQCGSLGELADDLERIRGELERHSDGFLSQVDGTLNDHSRQLSQLQDRLKDCASETDPATHRGDQ